MVLDPLTQPLSWMLDGALYGMLSAPWWIIIPAILAVVWLVSRSRGLIAFVAGCILLLAFVAPMLSLGPASLVSRSDTLR